MRAVAGMGSATRGQTLAEAPALGVSFLPGGFAEIVAQLFQPEDLFALRRACVLLLALRFRRLCSLGLGRDPV